MEFICDRLNEFIELFIDGSSIELVEYNNKTKKWTISYSYDVTSDEFESVDDMLKFYNQTKKMNNMKKTILSFIFVIISMAGFSQSLYEYTDLSNYRVKVGELVLNGQKMRPITPLVNQVLMYDGLRWKNQNEKDLIFAADSANIVKYIGNDRDLDMGANSISTDTVKIDGVPLLLNTFKKGNLGGASNIFYSTGASSQPESGTIAQLGIAPAVTGGYLPRSGGSMLNTNLVENLHANFANSIYSTPFQSANLNTLNKLGQFSARPVTLTGSSNMFPAINNANAIITLDTYDGTPDYLAQLGFNFIGDIYTRVGILGDWNKIYHSGNSNSQTIPWNASQFISHVPTGTAPLVVASTTKVDNLNVEMLDGKHASDFLKYTDKVIQTDTVKVNKDLIVAGEIYNEINHLYAMVYDSTIVTTLTKDVWQQVTNTTKTLYSASEQDGITILGDTIVFSKAGGYDVYFEFNNIGIDKKEYHYRILQKNGSTVVRSYNKYASTGIQQVRNEKAYIQANAGAKVWCEVMSPSPVPGDVTIQGSKVYAMQRYLER